MTVLMNGFGVIPSTLASLPIDGRRLVVARCLRLFAYGFLSVILVFYLAGIGIDERRTGLLLSLTLVGDTLISLWLTTRADRAGRRLTLVIGALLMAGASVVFALTGNFALLLIAGVVGVISPSGKEVGPFLSVEQAAFSHVVPADRRTGVFAWTNLVGSLSGALGVLLAGWTMTAFHHSGASPVTGYRTIVVAYGVVGLALAALFARMRKDIEWTPTDGPAPPRPRGSASGPSRGRLCFVWPACSSSTPSPVGSSSTA